MRLNVILLLGVTLFAACTRSASTTSSLKISPLNGGFALAPGPLANTSPASSAGEEFSDLKRAAYVWTYFGPDAGFWVRAVSDSQTCPSLRVDGQSVQMTVRSPKDSLFPVNVCQAKVSSAAQQMDVDKNPLALPNLSPKKIVILGDTGCVIAQKTNKLKVQSCNDPAKWPFAQIAKSAAQWKPDLVIHVGDYHYREIECPSSHSGCKGSVSGDRWNSWQQDFFEPAEPLLKAAPWVFARGNHELCERAGNGWFKLLETRDAPDLCSNKTDPYRIPLNGISLAMIDSADAANILPSLTQLLQAPQIGEWYILHRPVLSSAGDEEDDSASIVLPQDLLPPGRAGLFISGHQHNLSINQFKDARPPELVSGNGGTALEKSDKSRPIAEMVSLKRFEFGFLTLEKQGDSKWLLSARDTTGKELIQCDLKQESNQKTKMNCTSLD